MSLTDTTNSYAVQMSQQQFAQKMLKPHFKSVTTKGSIIFKGYSRVGKSLLSMYLSGIPLKMTWLDKYQRAVLQPKDQQLIQEKLVGHSKISVTQFPNFFQTQLNNQKYTVIDLPGSCDNSIYRQICNTHYIKNTFNKINEGIIILVLNINNKQKRLRDKDIEQMKKFQQTFPNSSNNVLLILNFIQLLQCDYTEDQYQNVKQKVVTSIRKQLFEYNAKGQTNFANFYLQGALNPKKVLIIPKVTKNYYQKHKNSQFQIRKLKSFIMQNIQYMQKIQKPTVTVKLSVKINILAIQLVEKYLEECIQNLKQILKKTNKLFTQLLTAKSEKKTFSIETFIKENYQKNTILFDASPNFQLSFQRPISNLSQATQNQIIIQILQYTTKIRQNLDRILINQFQIQKSIIQFSNKIKQYYQFLSKRLYKIFYNLNKKELEIIFSSYYKSICMHLNNLQFLTKSLKLNDLQTQNTTEDQQQQTIGISFLSHSSRGVFTIAFSINNKISHNYLNIIKQDIKNNRDCQLLKNPKNIIKLEKVADSVSFPLNLNYIKYQSFMKQFCMDADNLSTQQLYQLFKNIRETQKQISSNQKEKFMDDRSKQWESIKIKIYRNLVKILLRTSNINFAKISEYLIKIKSLNQILFNLTIKNIHKHHNDHEKQSQNSLKIYIQSAERTAQYFYDHFEFQYSQKVYRELIQLYRQYDDQESQKKIKQLYQKFIQLQLISSSNQLTKRKQEFLNQKKWKAKISTNQFKELFNRVDKQIDRLYMRKQELQQSVSSFSNSVVNQYKISSPERGGSSTKRISLKQSVYLDIGLKKGGTSYDEKKLESNPNIFESPLITKKFDSQKFFDSAKLTHSVNQPTMTPITTPRHHNQLKEKIRNKKI